MNISYGGSKYEYFKLSLVGDLITFTFSNSSDYFNGSGGDGVKPDIQKSYTVSLTF